MKNYKTLIVILLITLCFAAGYTVRTNAREKATVRRVSVSPVRAPGVPVATTQLRSAGDIDLGPLEIMLTVLRNVREHFVDPITPSDEGRMAREALRAMLASLQDPNTRFLDPEQLRLAREAAEGRFHGIGAILGMKKVKTGNIQEEHLVVITPIDSGPAAKAGLKSGDHIIAIDGRDVLPLDPFQRANEVIKEERKKAVDRNLLKKHIESETKRIEEGIPILKAERMLTSEDDKEFELTVLRDGATKPIKVKVKTQDFTVEPVSWTLVNDGRFGYIRISCFSNSTPQQFETAVKELKSKEVEGLVLDLRDVAAGDLETVLSVARLLVPERVFGFECKSRNRKIPIRVERCSDERVWKGSLVVLVNAGTARMAEALAVALRDNLSAKLVGESTYGDPSVVTLMELSDGSGVSITTGQMAPPKSSDYRGKGLAPDVSASSSEQMKEAIKILESLAKRSVSTLSRN